jgi:hypothetical protein
LFGEVLHRRGRDGPAWPQLTGALAAAEAMTPTPPALVAHIAAQAAQVAAAAGDPASAARLRERARAALAAVAPGRNAERDEVVRLLGQEQGAAGAGGPRVAEFASASRCPRTARPSPPAAAADPRACPPSQSRAG